MRISVIFRLVEHLAIAQPPGDGLMRIRIDSSIPARQRYQQVGLQQVVAPCLLVDACGPGSLCAADALKVTLKSAPLGAHSRPEALDDGECAIPVSAPRQAPRSPLGARRSRPFGPQDLEEQVVLARHAHAHAFVELQRAVRVLGIHVE
jgi:hypothetical protein